jgi:hypothetical protein
MLLSLCGLLAVSESRKITKAHTIPNWFSGPSGYIMIVGGLLCLFAVHELYSAIQRWKKGPLKPADKQDQDSVQQKQLIRDMTVTFLLLPVYLLLIPLLGFNLASIVYMGLNLYILKNSVKSIVVTAIVLFLGMLFLLPPMGISLPRGIFGF